MEARENLPSLSEFAWNNWLIIHISMFMANIVLALLKISIRVWVFDLKGYVEPSVYFRTVVALVTVTFIFVFFAWFRHVRQFGEIGLQESVVVSPGVGLSDEEEASLEGGRSITDIVYKIIFSIPPIVLNLYMFFNTPFVLD